MRNALGNVLFFGALAATIGALVLSSGVLGLVAGGLAVVAGVLAVAGLIGERHEVAEMRSQAGPWLILLGLAGIGAALESMRPDALWSILAFPAAALLGLIAATQTIRGRGWWIDALRDSSQIPSFLARPTLAVAVVILAFAILWSLGFVDL